MKRITWSPLALDDFESLLVFIAEQSPANAALVRGRIIKSVEVLTDFQFGQEGPIPDTYRLYIPKTSYFLIYRFVVANKLEIVAFRHASSDWMHHVNDDEI